MQVRNLENSVAELDERLRQLTLRLEPIMFHGPEKPDSPQLTPPDSPMSPICDFIRQIAKKINQLERGVHHIIQQIQI